ncbi:hypothetical protein NFI96_022173 [Prochilodus magdalenae]|nr:hypothetical protein NFI96_022173 [Prochilodus magdalenae]
MIMKQKKSQKVTKENGGEGGNPETEGVVLLSCKETIHAEEPHSEDKVKSSSNKAEVEGLAKLTTEAGLPLLNGPEKTHADDTFEEPNKMENAIDKAALNHNETTETTFLAEEPHNKVGNATGEEDVPLSINETTNAEHIVAEEPRSDDKVKSPNSEADNGQKEEKDDKDAEDTAPKEPHNEVGTETGKDADPVENGMDTTPVASEVAEEAQDVDIDNPSSKETDE